MFPELKPKQLINSPKKFMNKKIATRDGVEWQIFATRDGVEWQIFATGDSVDAKKMPLGQF